MPDYDANLAAELRRGEDLLWIGTPDPLVFSPAQLIAGAMVSAMPTMVIVNTIFARQGTAAYWAWGLLIFTTIASFWLLRLCNKARCTVHAVTNHRLLTVIAGRTRVVTSRALKHIVGIQRRQRANGSETVVFDFGGIFYDGEGGSTIDTETWRAMSNAAKAEQIVWQQLRR